MNYIWVELLAWETYRLLWPEDVFEVVGYSEFDRSGTPKWVELRRIG